MSELADTIEARVAGHDLVFALPRGAMLTVLEDVLGASAFEVMRRLTSGDWRAADVTAVLVHAARPTWETGRLDIERTIRRAVEARPGLYRALAAQTLAAGLIGVAPTDARFTDEEEADA